VVKPLLFDNVVKRFGGSARAVTALAGIDFEIDHGAFVAMMGASGSGKSTLLHLAAGLTRPDSGRVLIDGEDLGEMTDRQLTLFRRRRVGLVFQSFNLIPTLSARENVALPLRLGGMGGVGALERADEMLGTLGLAARGEHRPDAMSGGEQQRVAIGRALVTRPAMILADEPTGNLDSASSQAICELLAELNQQEQVAVVLVTHEPSVAAYAGQVSFLSDGQVVEESAVTDRPAAAELANRYQAVLAAQAAAGGESGRA